MAEVEDPKRDGGQDHRGAEHEQEGKKALADGLEEGDPGDPKRTAEGIFHIRRRGFPSRVHGRGLPASGGDG